MRRRLRRDRTARCGVLSRPHRKSYGGSLRPCIAWRSRRMHPPMTPAEPQRLRLWLERAGAGVRLRDAATGEHVRWEDPRIRVVPVAGVSFRAESLADES